MIESFAVSNYRSLREIITPLSQLNVVTGANGTGKSNLYKALILLAEASSGSMVNGLAKEGGLESTFWAGPESFSKEMTEGRAEIQGGPKKRAARLKLGFSGEDFGYSISLGLPPPIDRGDPDPSKFHLDHEIKRECIWAGSYYRPASCLVDRKGPVVKVRNGRTWEVYAHHMNSYESILSEISDPVATPEIFSVRQAIRSWRFYDHFRTDREQGWLINAFRPWSAIICLKLNFVIRLQAGRKGRLKKV